MKDDWKPMVLPILLVMLLAAVLLAAILTRDCRPEQPVQVQRDGR